MRRRESENEIDIEYTEDKVEAVVCSLVDYYDQIETMSENAPKDRRSKEYKNWLLTINSRIKAANKIAGWKIYKPIL